MSKKTKIISIIVAVAVLAGIATAGFLLWKNNSKDSDKKSDAETASSTDNEEVADANYVDLGEGFTDVEIVDGDSAIEAAESVSDKLGIDDEKFSLELADESSFDGENYYRLQQYYEGYPVYGREVVLIADDDGKALSLTSNLAHIEQGSTGDAKDAADINYKELIEGLETLLKNDQFSFLDFKCTTQPETVFYSQDGMSVRPCFKDIVSFKDADGNPYTFQILFDCNTYEIVDVDYVGFYEGESVEAHGEDREGENQTFTAYHQGLLQYYMYDEDRDIMVFNANDNTLILVDTLVDSDDNEYYYVNGELIDADSNTVYLSDDGTEIVDEDGKTLGKDLKHELRWTATPNADELEVSSSMFDTWSDENAVSAISRVQNADDFYDDVLNRNGFDDHGSPIRVFYNDTLDGNSTNAYSCSVPDMTALSFGAENNIAYDCVGHEFTHSVLGSIVDLPYRNQPGAINEAYADIFGEIIEDYSDGEIDNSCNWKTDVYRSHIDPLEDGNPVEYKGENWALNISIPSILSDTPLDILNTLTDNGGVHTNSTVLSHAAYLMTEGIDGDKDKKIDNELLAKIWYKSMFSIHSDETFNECAKHVYEAAQRTDDVTEDQLDCIKEAFEQAGLEVE